MALLTRKTKVDPLDAAHQTASDAVATFGNVIADLDAAATLYATVRADAEAEAELQHARALEATRSAERYAAVASNIRKLVNV